MPPQDQYTALLDDARKASVKTSAPPSPLGKPQPAAKEQPPKTYDTLLQDARKWNAETPRATFMETLGKSVPESAVPALRTAQKILVDPFEKAAKFGGEHVSKYAGELTEDVLGLYEAVRHPGIEMKAGPGGAFLAPTRPTQDDYSQFKKEHPNVAGLAVGAAKGVGSVAGSTATDPRNWPFFLSGAVRPILQRVISGGFGAQMAAGAIDAAKNLLQNWGRMNPEERTQAAVESGLSAVMAYGSLSHAFSSELAGQIKRENPDATRDQVLAETVRRLGDIRNKLSQMPAAQRAEQLQAMGLPIDLTVDHVDTALDHINTLRAQRPAMEPPPPPPEKVHREGPEFYPIDVRPLTPVEREAKRYSLEEARRQLDDERRIATQEQDAKDEAEKERQRIARDRQVNREGEAQYRAQRAGRVPVVTERRPLTFDTKQAEQNYGEYERLGEVLDGLANEHMYVDTEDMVRSLKMERYRGINLREKYGEWSENVLNTEARRREYLRLSDPRVLEPKKTDLLRDAAEDMKLAAREMNMREAADKIDREAQAATEPAVFEKAKAEADEARSKAEELRNRREQAFAARAAQIADRQIYPVGAPIDLIMGAQTEVILPSGRRLKAHYAVAQGDQLITSHNPMTFEWNDDFGPRQAQPRDYSTNQEAQAGVITGGNAPEPERVHTDDPSPHNGPAIIRRDGLVIGGNGRTMRMQRAYRLGSGDVIYRHLRSKLGQFDLKETPDLEKKPTLVRVLDEDPENAEDLFVLGRDLNRTETMGFDVAEQAVVAGRAMSDAFLEWGAAQMDYLGEDTSLRDLMRARGGEIVQRMMDSGMIEPTKRAVYITRNGEMTEAAKDLFEAAWLGKIIDEPDLLKTAPRDVLRKLTRAVPGMVKAKLAGAMWDISPEIKDALLLWKRIDSVRESLNEIGTAEDSLVDRYLHPQDFENGTELMDFGTGTSREVPHPEVEALAKLLEKPQADVKNGLIDYGNEAEGKQATLGPPPEPVDSFNRFIGNKVGIEIHPDQWATPMAPTNKEAVAAPEAPIQQTPEPAVKETPEIAPPSPEPLGTQKTAIVDKLRTVLGEHPGFRGVANEVLAAADILSRNGMGKPLADVLSEVLADVRTEGEPGAGGMEQATGDLAAFARRAGRKLQIIPYGEQLDLFGGAEPQFILRSKAGDERLVLKSELLKIRAEVPRLQELVDASGNINQSQLFGAEEENLFGPGEEKEPDQGSLFQEGPPSEDQELAKLRKLMMPENRDVVAEGRMSSDIGQWQPPPELGVSNAPDYGLKAREDVEKAMGPLPRDIADVAKPERDTAVLKQVQADHPDWTLSQQLQEAARRVKDSLFQSKKGATEFLEDGKAVIYLYKTADASTFMHEFFHVMRRHLKPEDAKVLEDWLKIKDGKWSRKHEETAARGFEYYHRQREVKTLPEKVQAVFKTIQDAMRQIYAAIKGSPLVKPSKEVAALFDRWYGMEPAPEGPREAAPPPSLPEPPKPLGQKFKFGNTQTNIPAGTPAAKAIDEARTRIDDADLAGKGKDIGGNHITVRYGIDGEDTAGIKKFLKSQHPIEARLGKTDKFDPTAQSEGATVIIAPVEAPELHRINDELAKHGTFTDPSFDYRPHATIAYVKPEAAGKYVGMDVTDGKTFPITEVEIRTQSGKSETVKLTGKEKVPTSIELEQPPLSPAEREGAELIAEGGNHLLDTGITRTKVFDEYGKAESWAKTNAKKIRSLQLYKLKDGRFAADFVAHKDNVLFQTADTGDVNREIADIEKRLMRIMPEADRSRLAQRLFDLQQRKRAAGEVSRPAMEPPPGRVIKLWTPEGETAVEEEPRGPRTETRPVRTAANVPAPVPEPPRFGGVPEQPEPSRVSRPEPSTGGTVRGGRGSEEPRVRGGQPEGTLKGVSPIRIEEPVRPVKPPVYADKDWAQKVALYKLPENAPTPTVGISNALARMLMGGQRYITESALSGLDRHDSFILATTTGSGKTYVASAIMHHLLADKPDAQILIMTPSRTLIDGSGGFKRIAGDFGVEVQDLESDGQPGEPGVYATTWAASLNRPGIDKHPWDLVIADEVQEARKWYSSQRGAQMKRMSTAAKKVLYMSATPFHTALEVGHMEKLGLWRREGFDTWARQFGVHKDAEGNYAGGNAPLKLTKLRQQLIERGQFIEIPREMSGYSAHFGVVPMDGKTKQGLVNIKKAMDLAENYFYAANKRGKVMPTRAQAVTLAKRWLEYQRLPQAIELGKKLEAQGWKVIFFSENKKEFDEIFEFLKEADEGTGGQISSLLPKFRSIDGVLQEHFGDDIGVFAGRQSGARDEYLSEFNQGDRKHLYTTYGAGGVGVSMHDTVGNAPRAVIYLGPPWSGISFDQALGRPWRYGTRSNVRSYFLFSNAQAEMDIVTNKVAPRMESLRALVSGVHLTDPLVKAMREIPENREATLDYELGNEHKAGMDDFVNSKDSRAVTSYSELPIVHADTAKNQGMKLPGGDGATNPNIVKLFQAGEAEEETVPQEMESPSLRTARNINVEIAQEFINSGAAPGDTGTRNLSPIDRRRLADAVMAMAEGAARGNPEAATQQVYSAWQNAMTQIDAIMSASGGGEGMEPPPGEMTPPPPPPSGDETDPKKIGTAQALNWYFATNGRDVIRNATKAAGVAPLGEKLARDIAAYHVYGGNVSGPWVQEYWDILKNNKISKDEHTVLALTMANREEHRPWIDRELMRLRSTTPMNERIAAAVEQLDGLRSKVFKRMADSDVYLTVWDAETGRARKILYSEMERGEGYWPRKYDYDETHTVIDPETGKEINFTLREMTKTDAPGGAKREAIIKGMMERHGLSRGAVEDWLGSRKRPVPLMGHIERAREADLPFFRTDPNVMVSYLEGAGEVLARQKYFGQDGSKVAGTIAQIPDKTARDITKEIVDSLLQRSPFEDESKWMVRMASDWAVLSKMTFSSLKVLSHSAHGAVLTNTRAFFRALLEGVVNYKDAVRMANLSGSTMEQTKVEMLSEFGVNKKGLASSMLRYNLWQAGYKWGRVVADANARVYMDKYALPELLKDPENSLMRRQLKEWMLLDDKRIDDAVERGRWTDEDHHWAGKAFSDKVMFTFDPTELPPLWRAHSENRIADSGLAVLRISTLLRGYQFKTHALLKDAIYDEIKNHGNLRPLIPFLTLYPAMGALIWTLSSLAQGNTKYFKELLSEKKSTVAQALERYVEDIAHQIGDSQLIAAIKAFEHGKSEFGEKILDEWLVGAVPSDVLRTISTSMGVAFAKNNRARKKAVEKFAKDTFPVVRTLENVTPKPRPILGPVPPPPPPQ